MKTLYAKLAASLMLLLFFIGALFFILGYYAMRDYYEEITQELNKNIAMYITDHYHFMQDYDDNESTLRQLAERAMTINPTLEVYLLDTQGQVLHHMQPSERAIRKTKIDLAPIHEFLRGASRFPLRGPDPLNPEVEKIFSAAEIYNGDRMAGYLYVIVGGAIHDTIADNIRSSYVLQTSIWYALILMVSAVVLGLWVFKSLTFRLRQLVRAVRNFYVTATPASIDLQRQDTTDEISLLNNTLCTMAEKINEQFDHIKQVDEHRRELISNVSHDLRTPLATTQGYIETLLIKGDTLETPVRQRYLRIAQRSIEHLAKLVHDLFELSKLEAGQAELQLEAFPLMELIYDTVQKFAILAEKKNIAMYMPSPNQQMRVLADMGMIQRVLDNLISNAIKFTPQGGSIAIGYKLHKEAIRITVKDTGRGIAPDHLPKIFERYYASKEITNDSISTGLGLAIAKKILELHQSTISVNSTVNQGSEFQFSLLAA